MAKEKQRKVPVAVPNAEAEMAENRVIETTGTEASAAGADGLVRRPYRVVGAHLLIDGRFYQPGKTVLLSDEEAERLLRKRLIEQEQA